MTTATEARLTDAERQSHAVMRKLRDRRMQLELTLREAADKLGCTEGYLWRTENQRTKHLWLDSVIEYADALDCDLEIVIKPRVAKSGRTNIG